MNQVGVKCHWATGGKSLARSRVSTRHLKLQSYTIIQTSSSRVDDSCDPWNQTEVLQIGVLHAKMGGLTYPRLLPANDEVFHQNPECRDDCDRPHEIPKRHYLNSSTKYHIRRER